MSLSNEFSDTNIGDLFDLNVRSLNGRLWRRLVICECIPVSFEFFPFGLVSNLESSCSSPSFLAWLDVDSLVTI